ncbi:polysaccharide deacetylase family protein [Actinoplanes sp. CA-030573]|uniref:polysaccharide deacetylase family protein n=1 Tax=Actinoplanes sp. CA-030573 TaxID=3239898 RepID=UPI003D8FFDE9
MTVRKQMRVTLRRLAAVTVTLATLGVPTATYLYVKERVQLGEQQPAPSPPALSPAAQARFRAASTSGRSFVVLGYHDLVDSVAATTPSGGRRVSVSATAFAAHLRMLRLAGYRSVSAAEVAEVVNGRGALPPHAVLLTFDGARWRDWSYADPILKAYGFQATVFVDPATVLTQRGTTLSWRVLRRMTGSGRWSVGVAGTKDTVEIGPGRAASALLGRRWLTDRNRPETAAAYGGRIQASIDRQRRTVVAHGLAEPRLFSYPFQPRYPLPPDQLTSLTRVVTGSFDAATLTLAGDTTADEAWLKKRILPRLEIYGSTTDEMLFNRIQNLATS